MTIDRMAYLKLIRPYFFIITCLFLLAIIAGYIAASNNPELAETITTQFNESYGWLIDESPIVIMLFIFLNNTIISFLALLIGIFFGIWPVLLIVINGTVIGVICHEAISQYGRVIVIAALVPHGIIELPAVLISASIGLRLGQLTVLKILKIKDVKIKEEVFNAVRFFVAVIVPLLFIAAVIETFITPFIVYILISH